MQATDVTDVVAGPRHGVDRVGHVETRGIDFIPEAERHSNPRDLAWVFFGAQFTYAAFILGALPIVFGLNWWSAFTAILVGSVVGAAAFGGMAVMGPKTGTNGTVSSAAFFGIRGRYVGSFIAQIIDLGFFALTTWAGAEALLSAGHRWFDIGTGNGPLAIAMALVAAVTLLIGILGHATLVAYEKFISVSNLLIMALVVALATKHFTAHQAHAQYALGSFSATWFLGSDRGDRQCHLVRPICQRLLPLHPHRDAVARRVPRRGRRNVHRQHRRPARRGVHRPLDHESG